MSDVRIFFFPNNSFSMSCVNKHFDNATATCEKAGEEMAPALGTDPTTPQRNPSFMRGLLEPDRTNIS